MNVPEADQPATEAGAEPPISHYASLREFVVANGSLLAATGGLIGIGTFVTGLPFFADWVQPYLAFLVLAAAVLTWLELLAQWPPELMIYQGPPPAAAPWRMVGFAYAVQLTMIVCIGGFLWRAPRLVMPAIATVVGLAIWRFVLPQTIKEQRAAFLVTSIAALVVSVLALSLVHPTYRSFFELLGSPAP